MFSWRLYCLKEACNVDVKTNTMPQFSVVSGILSEYRILLPDYLIYKAFSKDYGRT